MKWQWWMTWGLGWRTVCVYNFFMRHQSMSFLGSKIVLCFVLFCFVSFRLKYYLSLVSKMKKIKIFKQDYLFPYRSFSWDQKLASRDCISPSLTWLWSIMRSVTVCAKETRAGSCILHSSALPHWHPGSPTSIPHPHQHLPQGCQMLPLAMTKLLLIVSIQNLSCLLEWPSICRTG